MAERLIPLALGESAESHKAHERDHNAPEGTAEESNEYSDDDDQSAGGHPGHDGFAFLWRVRLSPLVGSGYLPDLPALKQTPT